MNTRCENCKWVHEADTNSGASYMGVAFCPTHNRAVNAYNELLEMLTNCRSMLHAISIEVDHGPGLKDNTEWMVKSIDKAIAKAEGKE